MEHQEERYQMQLEILHLDLMSSVGAFDSDDTTSQSYQDFNSSTITRVKQVEKLEYAIRF